MSNTKEITMEKEYVLKAPLAEVYAFLSNPENDDIWQGSCDRVEMQQPGEPVVAGSKYNIHFSFLSRKMSFEAEVSEYEFEKSYGYQSTEGPMPYEGRYVFTETDQGVHVHWTFGATPGKFFGIIPKALIRKTMDKKVLEDIERLQQHFANSAIN